MLNTKNKDDCYSIKECLEIKNLFYMKSKICDKDEFSYMKLGEFKTSKPLQTVSEIMEADYEYDTSLDNKEIDFSKLCSKYGFKSKR